MANLLDLKNPPVSEPEPVEPEEVDVAEEEAPPEGLPERLEWEERHPLPDHAWRKHYLALGLFAVAGCAVAWWQSSWLVLIATVIGAVAWELHERMHPPVRVVIDSRGVTVDGRHFPHSRLASFDIHAMPDGTAELSLHTDGRLLSRMRLPLGDQDPGLVRTMLSFYVPEERHDIPLYDRWLRQK